MKLRRWVLLVLVCFSMGLLFSMGESAPKEMRLRVTDPGGSTEWVVGKTVNLKWSVRGELGKTVSISLQRGGWTHARMVIAEAVAIGDGSTGTYKWSLPADFATGKNFTVSVVAENGIGDTSEEFSINPGKVLGTHISLEPLPKGAEKWAVGDKVMLRWSFAGNPAQMVKLALIHKEEGSVTEIAAAIPIGSAGKGQYEWTVPALKPRAGYYLGIVGNTNSFYQDMSKDAITIMTKK